MSDDEEERMRITHTYVDSEDEAANAARDDLGDSDSEDGDQGPVSNDNDNSNANSNPGGNDGNRIQHNTNNGIDHNVNDNGDRDGGEHVNRNLRLNMDDSDSEDEDMPLRNPANANDDENIDPAAAEETVEGPGPHVLPGAGADANVNAGFEDGGNAPMHVDHDEHDGEEAVIYGTTVQVQAAIASFRRFLDTFQRRGEYYYRRRLQEIHETRELIIDIDCQDFYTSELEYLLLYKKLIQYPNEMIPALDLAVYQQFISMFPDDPTLESGERIQVRTFNLHKLSRMRQLDPEDIDMVVALRGMVVRVSPVIPDMKTAKFRCTLCNAEAEASIDRGVIEEPSKCDNCGKPNVMQLIHNLCLFSDKQMVKLQEAPENIPEGETPQTISMYAYDGLVDVAKPGDRVEVTAIYRASAVRKIATRRTTQAIYKTFLDVLHFRSIQKGANVEARNRNLETLRARLIRREHRQQQGLSNSETETQTQHRSNTDSDDDSDSDSDSENGREGGFDDDDVIDEHEQEVVFRQMSQDPDIYNKLAHSVAPSIWELDDIKKGVLLQLMGGTNKEATQQAGEVRSTHRMRSRGEINVLLCGDPGTSKSQILGYAHKLAPRGIYTSGKGSSAVGLTAYITKDPDTKELILESGALVLSDRGVCCIDEFDKMSDATRAILHECMEQQTISIAKAGIIATLNARTSILASANPVESRYNPRLSIVQNIQLPPTLISRFDLIYLVLDKPDPATDRRLARHLVQLYFRNPVARGAVVDRTTLRAYIAYCRRTCFPEISNSAVRKLVQGYVQMRQAGSFSNGKKTISATPRQLESLIRLSEAHAKLQLSDVVTEANVDEALRLMHVATQTAAVDPRTGTIDMDAITTGVAATDRAMNEALAQEVLPLIPREGIRAYALTAAVNAQSSTRVTQEQVMNAVHGLLEDDQVLFDSRTGIIRVV